MKWKKENKGNLIKTEPLQKEHLEEKKLIFKNWKLNPIITTIKGKIELIATTNLEQDNTEGEKKALENTILNIMAW